MAGNTTNLTETTPSASSLEVDDDEFAPLKNNNDENNNQRSVVGKIGRRSSSAGKEKFRTILVTIFVVMTFIIVAEALWGIISTYRLGIMYGRLHKLQENDDASLNDPFRIDIVSYNDVYEIFPVDAGGELRGGASRVAAYVKSLRKARGELNRNVLVLGAGDFLSPSLLSDLVDGKQMIIANNLIGLNYTCIGNHEFDMGLSVMRQRFNESKFQWVNSNLLAFGELIPGSIENAIIDLMPAARIGIFGLSYNLLSTLSNSTGITVLDAYEVAAQQVQKLKDQGATFIIVLTHMFISEDCELVRRVPGIDMVIGGHDHKVIQDGQCGDAIISKATQDWQNIWHSTIYFNATGTPVSRYTNIPVTMDMPTDPETDEALAPFAKLLEESFSEVIGATSVPLDTQVVNIRTKETNAGDFFADQLRSYTNSDVAIINGGSIRSNTIHAPGNITLGYIFDTFPFGDVGVKIRINGSVLWEAIENGVSALDTLSGRFPQISGFRFAYAASAPKGSRVRWLTFINGTTIPPEAELTLATTEYVMEGGDDYKMFATLPVLISPNDAELLTTVFAQAIRSHGIIAPVTDGRITSVGK